jgi:D-arginine dehydrogenase
MATADFLVIGAGIAGASVAYELAAAARVVVLEREPQPGYHSTGRSAALFSEIYGNETVRGLSRASRNFFLHPPVEFSEVALLNPRGSLYLASREQRARLERFRDEPDVIRNTRELTTQAALDLVPVLRPECAAYCVLEPGAMDVEVAVLHQSFLRGLRRRGGAIVQNCAIDAIEYSSGRWSVRTADADFSAPVLIDAAGAWADEVAALAGVRTIGLEPKRRTALLFKPAPELKIDAWPMVHDVEETYYFKPDAGKLLLSPVDESPSSPCDVQPDEMDVAIAVDRLEQATTLSVKHVTHSWAGLRSFVPDRSPVAGFDGDSEGFFWLAAQGGYGIQTSPALSRTAAALASRRPIPADIASQGVEAGALSPLRLLSALGQR